MKVVVLQSNYLPWKGYFDLIHDADVFIFYDEAKYTKNDWRNRNKVYSSGGLHWLTIPISKQAVKLKISEVRLEDDNWQQAHFDLLVNTYRKAPYFFQLEGFLDDFFRQRKWEYLSEMNQYAIRQIAAYMGIQTVFRNSSEFNLSEGRVDRLVDLVRKAGATEYISGPSARNYLSGFEHLFAENSIILTYKNYSGYPAYRQLSTVFEEKVSVLDLIANVRKEEIPDYIWTWREGLNQGS